MPTNEPVEFKALSFQELTAKYGESGVAELANVTLKRRAATRARMAKPAYRAKAQERRAKQKQLLEWAKSQQHQETTTQPVAPGEEGQRTKQPAKSKSK